MKKACQTVEKEKGKSSKTPSRGATLQDIVAKLSNTYSREEIMSELQRRNNPDKPMFEGELKPDTIITFQSY